MVRHFVSSFLCLSSLRSSLVTSFVSQVESGPNREQLRQQFSSLIVKMSAILAQLCFSVFDNPFMREMQQQANKLR